MLILSMKLHGSCNIIQLHKVFYLFSLFPLFTLIITLIIQEISVITKNHYSYIKRNHYIYDKLFRKICK